MEKESHWTQPQPWCEHPEWWHAPDSESAESEVTWLVAAFIRALQPSLVVETGSNIGSTSKAIGEALLENGHGRLYTLELVSQFVATTAEKCAGLPVTVVHGSSLTWWPPAPIDFAWHDSELGIRHVEIENWLPMYSPGAIVGIHDTGPHYPVLHLLRPLVEAGHLRPITLRTPRGVTFAEIISGTEHEPVHISHPVTSDAAT